jgi:ATP-dependent Zn protease
MSRLSPRFQNYGAAHFVDCDDEPPRTPQSDPARVAVGLMLEHALTAAGTTADEAGCDGTVCIVLLPHKAWTDAAAAEWRAWVRREQRPIIGRNVGDSEEICGWVLWSPSERPRPSEMESADEGLARSVARGRHCVGITADPSWLPPDMARVADVTLAVQPCRAADIALLTAFLCGQESGETMTDAQSALLTPRLLRLARRPGQSADDYVRRLRALLDAENAVDAAVPTESPRDTPRLERLHGMDEAVAGGMAVKADLDALRAGKLGGGELDRGCLLSGPPGCGKTLFARSFAATCGIPLVAGSYSLWYGTGGAHQGDLLKAMRKTFADARSKAPCVLFIDEVDSFPNRATITHHYADWEIQVVNALLEQIDGVEGRDGVILLAACNHPDKLDAALVRSGRLDRHIRIRLPGRAALERIFREHLGADLVGESLSHVALSAAGLSGADCERVVRSARQRARQSARAVAVGDLMAEIRGEERSAEEMRIASIHEAGHAVALCDLFPGMLRVVSLQARDDNFGLTMSSAFKTFLRASAIRAHLAFILAGRAAEEVLLGAPSSSSGGGLDSDLAQATRIAALAVSALGFDDVTGLVWSGLPDMAGLPEMLASNPAVTARVRQSLDEAYADALALVRRRHAAVEGLAAALLERHVLEGAEAEAIVARCQPAETVR